MSKDSPMHVQKNKTQQHTSSSRISPANKPVGANELSSYAGMMAMNHNGTLLRQEEVQQLREQQGFCPTCNGTPVKLFEVRKTKLNPLWKSREPLTVPNESFKGQCLRCHPNKAAEASPSSSYVRASMLTTQTQGTSSGSSFVEGKLTVTKYEDSQDLSGSMVVPQDPVVESSFHTTSARDSSLVGSQLSSQEPGGMQSFKKNDFPSLSFGGKPKELNTDSLKGSASSPVVAKPVKLTDSSLNRSKSPPKVLTGIPTKPELMRKDPLDASRRNSAPVVSATFAPPISTIEHPKDKANPSDGVSHHPNRRRASAPVKYDFSSVPLKPDPKRTFVARATKRSLARQQLQQQQHRHRHQAAETLDQLNIVYEHNMDDISALTLDIEQTNSSSPPAAGPSNSNNDNNGEGASSNGSDSLLEEFSVPDFSMETGKAVKAHRKQSNAKAKGRVSPPRKMEGNMVCKAKADMIVHKPKPRPASGGTPRKKKNVINKYTMMESGVSALPGPPDTSTRVQQGPRDSPPVVPHGKIEFPTKSVEGFASVPLHGEDGFALAPPLLVDMPETMGELTVETKTAGDVASSESKVEEVASLINDVVAAENTEFLAELLSTTMRSHREQGDIQSLCLHTIWEMSKYNDENKSSIMVAGLHDCIISAMKDFPDSVEVQGNGCGALWSLAVNQFNRVILVRAGACERILRALDTHLNAEAFVQTAFGALRTVSPDREARLALNHMLGSQRVVRAMALHRFVINIQRDGCAILSNVAVDMEIQEVSVVSREELQAVVRAMRDHLKTESVITSACFALKNFSYEERNVRNLRRFEDVVSLLEDVAQYATKASCRRDAGEVLKRIQMLESEDAALEETAFSSLMQAMRRTNTEKNPAKQVEESVSTITEVIKEYYWSIRLICFGLESLLSLADKSEAHMSRVLSPKTLRVVVNTMKEHKLNPMVQQRGCELLRFLTGPNKPVNRMEICMEEGCSVIVSALQNHRGDESVEIPAYASLQALSQEPLCAEEIERCGGWQILMERGQSRSPSGLADALCRPAEAAHRPEESDFARRLSPS